MPTNALRLYRPELLLVDGRLERHRTVLVEVESGRIAQLDAPPTTDLECIDLPGIALLPGLANAHSHAFQRALRGRTQRRAPAGQDDFWSWREAMYETALQLDPDAVRRIAAMAFLDMLRSGFTAVGEFHYLHHQPDGRPYDDPNALANAIADAADTVGIRLTLLRVAYARGGFGLPPTARQRRFIEPGVDTFVARTEALEQAFARRDPKRQQLAVGIAPHSVRAVDLDWLRHLAAWRGLRVCHMHLAEQTAELDACRAAHGTTPLRLVADHTDLLDARFTAVHGTWFEPDEVALLAARGARICACPTTERDLGDGFLPATDIFEAGTGLCIGTDSHCQIDALEELRLIEGNERLRTTRRVVLSDAARPEPAAWLYTEVGARQGYASLGLTGGALEPGLPFDAVGLDLGHRTLLGCPDDAVLAAAVFAGDASLVREVWVQGRHLVHDGEHTARAAIERDYLETLRATAAR